MTFIVRQLLTIGHWPFLRQLHVCSRGVRTDDIIVVLAYDSFHILHTVVTYFDVVSVEYIMEFVALWEVFLN